MTTYTNDSKYTHDVDVDDVLNVEVEDVLDLLKVLEDEVDESSEEEVAVDERLVDDTESEVVAEADSDEVCAEVELDWVEDTEVDVDEGA